MCATVNNFCLNSHTQYATGWRMNRPDAFRTTVSMANVVWEMALEMMKLKGFNENFSAYVADLIRRDKERLAGGLPGSSSALEQIVRAEIVGALRPPTDTTAPAKPAGAPRSKGHPRSTYTSALTGDNRRKVGKTGKSPA